MREAFHIATTGRPGPVLLDIPKDIVDAKNPNSAMDWYWPDDASVRDGLPGYRPTTKGHPRKIREAAEMILRSERPVIYAGGGILKARAAEALRELAELCDIHVVTTLMARGAFPDSHPLCLGHAGHARQLHRRHRRCSAPTCSSRWAAASTTASPARSPAFAPEAKIIHVDIDPAELGKVRRPDVPIVGDCRLVIEELVAVLKRPARRRVGLPRPHGLEADDLGLAGEAPARLRGSPSPATPSSRSSCSSSCATTRRTTASSRRGWASTRCGRRSTGSSSTPTPG